MGCEKYGRWKQSSCSPTGWPVPSAAASVFQALGFDEDSRDWHLTPRFRHSASVSANGRARPPTKGSGKEFRFSMTKPSPSPSPNNMGSESRIPADCSRVPVVTVSQCCPTNAAKRLFMPGHRRSSQDTRAQPRIAQHAREYPVLVVFEGTLPRGSGSCELVERHFAFTRFHRDEMLPAVEHVHLFALAGIFAHHHGPCVRPGRKPQMHERHLHPRQVQDARFGADTGALAASHLVTKAGTFAGLEAQRLEAPAIRARHFLERAPRLALRAPGAESIARMQQARGDFPKRGRRVAFFEQPREPPAVAAELTVVHRLGLADLARLEQQCTELTRGLGPIHAPHLRGQFHGLRITGAGAKVIEHPFAQVIGLADI